MPDRLRARRPRPHPPQPPSAAPADRTSDRAPIRVVVADDHPVVRAGLRHFLEPSAGIEIVAETGDGRALLRQVDDLRPDVVILEVPMPGLNGVDAARSIHRHHPGTGLVVLSAHGTEATVVAALEAGVRAYVLKDAAHDEIERAVRTVAAGMSYFSPAVAQIVAARVGGRTPRGARLSTREREIVQMLGEGRRVRDIAAKLFVSVQTVKTHRANAMRKLGTRSTAELVRYAIRLGLVAP
jgi:two-component system response regulator NreC